VAEDDGASQGKPDSWYAVDRAIDPAPADFLTWAMGSSTAAVRLVILPVLAGVVLGIFATFLHFGMRYPTAMWTIPWDLTANYECFVLPRNIARCCLLLAPLASALILVTQARFRSPASAGEPPGITAPFWLITAVGLLLVLIIPPAFDITGGGWFFACRIQDLYGIGGRIALTAMIVVVSPAASIAALTLAYRFRRFLAVGGTDAAEKALKPIGLVLIITGLLCIDYAIWNIDDDPGQAALTGIMSIATGFLVMKGSLGAARLTGWFNAATIATSVVQVVTAPLRAPLGLLQAKLHVEPLATVFTIALIFGSFGLALWLYQAVRAPAVMAARKASGRSIAPPWTGFAFGLVVALNQIIGIVMMQKNEYADEALKRAREKYGSHYGFTVTGYGISGGRVFVSLIGYDAQHVIDADVDWEVKAR
jgi:hypothetical protein